MRHFRLLIIALLSSSGIIAAAELKNLRIVYLTDELRPGRSEAFSAWLKPFARSFTIVTYSRTKTPTADELAQGDVVMLDWHQRSLDDGTRDSWPEQAARFPNPLGKRATWGTPTVLLGSAGLMVGHSWAVAGDRGCTCLQPLAYDLRDHPVTRGPFPIDRTPMVEIPLPEGFTEDLTSATVQVLPLVSGTPAEAAKMDPGWCVYLKNLLVMPDIEWISGGVNAKTTSAGGIWRQGNLLHFGFDQTPAQLNDNGRHLLANALCYIADFHQDRPIARQLIGVQGQAFLPTRSGLERWLRLRDDQGQYYEFALNTLAGPERQRVHTMLSDPASFAIWLKERRPYLCPDAQGAGLEVDERLLKAGITYDSPEFLTIVVGGLRSDQPSLVSQLVAHYLPDCPGTLSPAEQATWIERRIPWLFASDAAGYRWYVDSLGFARGIPSKSYRGPERRDRKGVVCDPLTGICTPE